METLTKAFVKLNTDFESCKTVAHSRYLIKNENVTSKKENAFVKRGVG